MKKEKQAEGKGSASKLLAFSLRPFHLSPVTSHLLLVFLITCYLSLSGATAAVPHWWIARGVINTNQPPDNYAPVNQGQLKHIATQAYWELEAKLPNGGGDTILDMLNSFSKTNANYLPVNLGQLKHVAKAFYDRLIAEGYAQSYPWTETKADDNSYALANQGQLKHVFSFDLSNFNPQPWDLDGDGLNDQWEQDNFGSLDPEPDQDPDNDGIPNSEEEQDESDPNNPKDGEQKSSYGIVSVGTGQWASRVNKKGTVVGVIQNGNNLTYYTWNKGEMKTWPGLKIESLNDENDIEKI